MNTYFLCTWCNIFRRNFKIKGILQNFNWGLDTYICIQLKKVEMHLVVVVHQLFLCIMWCATVIFVSIKNKGYMCIQNWSTCKRLHCIIYITGFHSHRNCILKHRETFRQVLLFKPQIPWCIPDLKRKRITWELSCYIITLSKYVWYGTHVI